MKFLLFIFVFLFLNTLSFANTQLTDEKNLVEKQILEEKSFEEKSSDYIKKLLRSRKAPLFFLTRKTLKKYYKTFDYQLIWTNEDGVKDIAIKLLDSIKNDPVIKPHSKDAFRLNKIIRELNSLNTSPKRFIESMTKIDFMLTGVYNRYMWFLSRGYIDWKKFKSELELIKEKEEINSGWEKYNVRKNHKKLLLKAINENDLDLAFNEVNFTYPQAKELSHKILDFETIAQNGGYTILPKSKALKLGKISPTIKILRQRLVESNDLESNNCDIDSMPQAQEYSDTKEVRLVTQGSDIIENDCFELFDESVKDAVISFQKRHGIEADGIVGPNTRKYLNIPVENKITQMRLNLERMRWMPRDLGEKFLVINIPEYKLKMYDEEKVKLDMRIVVGKRKHPTPVFSHKMSFIVINPYWKIPNSIVTKEIIPKMLKEPDYLTKTGINVHQTWDINSDILDSNSVNWSLYIKEKTTAEPGDIKENQTIAVEKKLPIYRFIQVPSDTNPLGRIKFMFPNRYSVYLHDSPAKHIFEYDKRAYSHGCVRLAQPKKLLEAIASSDINVDYTEANKFLEEIDKTQIQLDKKIPVHMVYLTSWIDEKGIIQFRDDIYKYDEIQKELLYKIN